VIRSLLVDLDGVLRFWDPSNDIQAEGAYGLPVGSIRATAFTPDLLLLAITGRISDEEWRRRIADRLKLHVPHRDAVRAVTAWSESLGEVNPDVLALVATCRRQASVHLLTNATSRLRRDLQRLGLSDVLDGVISSAEVGIPKPEAGIFEAALSVTGVAASETLFVDDAPLNVSAATRIGIIGHVFVEVDGLRREPVRRGVLAT